MVSGSAHPEFEEAHENGIQDDETHIEMWGWTWEIGILKQRVSKPNIFLYFQRPK